MARNKNTKSETAKNGSFPRTRMRRNRSSDWSRKLVRENSLHVNDLIWPVFVQEGINKKSEINSMPGVYRFTQDLLVKAVIEAKKLGIPAIAVFPVVDKNLKTAEGDEAINASNLICRTVRQLKKKVPEIGVICDVALDPYTTHGHDGIFKKGEVRNDETVELLCKQAVVQAEAGCDIVAPSDMMDGRIGAIRDALDAAGFENVKIMSYAAKYASSFYGPFRDAVGTKDNLGKRDKRTYQMDPANADEALREVELDIAEGADMVLIKPGMPYLDIIRRVKDKFQTPVFAYQVSGEYAMIKAAAEKNWLDEKMAMYESLISFKRAGAAGIFTYSAIEIAKLLRSGYFD